MWIRRRSEPLAALCALVLTTTEATAAEPQGQSAHPESVDDEHARFDLGMDQYRSGALTEAIGYWEPLYVELGPQVGYRVAYDLGVAYAALGDATRSAERLGAFLDEAIAREARGDALPAVVLKERIDAQARLGEFARTRARVHIPASSPATSVQIDAQEPRIAGFVAWLSPGMHTVTFAPGTPQAEQRTFEAHGGDALELAASRPDLPPAAAPADVPVIPVPPSASATSAPSSATPAPSSASPPTSAPSSASPATSAASPAGPPLPDAPARVPGAQPFTPWLLVIGGLATIAATAVAIPLAIHASVLRDRDVAEGRASGVIPTADRNAYGAAREAAYGTVAAAAGLGAVTAGLTAWYLASRTPSLAVPKRQPDFPDETTALPEISLGPGGVRCSLSARF